MTVQGHLPGRAIEINVDVIQTVDAATVPVSRADPPRTERRREREWDRARERVREVKVNNREASVSSNAGGLLWWSLPILVQRSDFLRMQLQARR